MATVLETSVEVEPRNDLPEEIHHDLSEVEQALAKLSCLEGLMC